MSKKDFKRGLDSLMGEDVRPKKVVTNTSKIGTKDNETRATFIVMEEYLDKLKAIAYWERLKIKDTINLALKDYVKQYEKDKGEIQPIPKKEI